MTTEYILNSNNSFTYGHCRENKSFVITFNIWNNDSNSYDNFVKEFSSHKESVSHIVDFLQKNNDSISEKRLFNYYDCPLCNPIWAKNLESIEGVNVIQIGECNTTIEVEKNDGVDFIKIGEK